MLLIVVVFALLGSAPAHAQTTTTEYPGTTTPPQPTQRTIDLGSLSEDERGVAEDCLFAPGATINVVLNGTPLGTATADQNGCVRVTITILSDGTAMGTITFAAAGLQAAQSTPRARITVNELTRDANVQVRGNVLRLTGQGSNGAPRTVTILFDVGRPDGAAGAAGAARGGAAGGGALSRTGGMILRWSLAGVALAGIGALLVVADRRRSRRPETTT